MLHRRCSSTTTSCPRTAPWHSEPCPSAAMGGSSHTACRPRARWVDWRVRDVASATDLPDVVRWSKFSGAAWLHDGSGFFYSRYAAPAQGDTYSSVNKHQQVYFHELGTTQDKDRLVYARPDQPDWGFAAGVTDDGRYLVLTQR